VWGLAGARTVWNGMPVYPAGFRHYCADVIAGHAKDFGADLVLNLLDIWAMDRTTLTEAGVPTACWMPVDTATLSPLDKGALDQWGGIPVAMSRHGEGCLLDAGFDPLYVPHGVPCDVFTPPTAGQRAAARERLGIPEDAFVIGIDAANKDPVRKGFPEQFAAFALFRQRHPGAVLLAHTTPSPASDEGINLGQLAVELGIQDAVRWSDTYKYVTGGYTLQDLAAGWYRALDLYTGCSYAEGFGLPLVQAQACGVPVVTTDAASMTELCGAGWLVQGQLYWSLGHQKWWTVPFVHEIAQAYEEAWAGKAAALAGQAREFALQYDARRVLIEHWVPALAAIEDRL